jgi:hypothetical protein
MEEQYRILGPRLGFLRRDALEEAECQVRNRETVEDTDAELSRRSAAMV